MDYESFATSRDSINVDPDTLFVSDDTNDDTNLNHSSNMDIDINSIPVNLENSPIPDVIPIVNETEADADTATCVSSTNPDFLSHDVGDIFGSISSITDEQKHVFLKDHFFPDENYTDFIKQHITKGKQKRQYTLSFQRSWLTQYPWLVYSPKQQGGLCKFCVLFQPKNERIKNAVLVNRPFTNLSKATGKDGVLQTHANCQYHKESVSLSSEFLNNYSKPQESIQYKLSSINEKNYNLNCHILHKIVQTIVLCGKQNIALRGHRDDSTTPSQATNKGNFLAILNLLAKSDDTLKTHLESPGNKNAKYTSKTIQNEVIEIVGILNLENAEALVDLPHGPWEWDRETRTKAQGLLHTMESSMFIVAFGTVKNCLEVIKPAAVKLQKREQDIYSAYQYIDNAKTTISQYRKDIDDLFRTWFKDAEALAALVGTEITKPRITGRQTNRANATSDSAEEYFRRNMAIPFSDHLDTEMKTRFQSQDRVGVELFGLLPSSSKSISDIEDFVKKLSFWKDDLVAPSSLRSELQLWNRFWEGKDPLPDSLLGCLNVADEDIFPNIRKLLIIGCTLPVTSCEAERSFSTLRRTKTYLRNSIGDERLAGLTLMNVHGDVDINIEDICKLFIQSHRRRMFKNSLLTAND
ncbi:unnamed protein product [Mytilus edulis]|uniref:TTF-type domain-containing protein n=1 Tax=Mytilus edulis TaxID=6550 RepID=A0A8S3VEW6_MYTED|nr:unnamed protein product [Mytilus edulis]